MAALNAHQVTTKGTTDQQRHQIQSLGSNKVTKHTLPNIARHQPSFTSVDQAVAFINTPRRQVAPDVDDTQSVRTRLGAYRQSIYNAMVILPEDASEWQQGQFKRYSNMVKGKKFSLHDLEAESWVVAEETVRLHEHGACLTEKYDLDFDSALGGPIPCSKRMESVVNIMPYNKLICIEVMESQLHLLRFITAPYTLLKAKEKDRSNHQHQQQKRLRQQSTAGVLRDTPNAPSNSPQLRIHTFAQPQHRASLSVFPKLVFTSPPGHFDKEQLPHQIENSLSGFNPQFVPDRSGGSLGYHHPSGSEVPGFAIAGASSGPIRMIQGNTFDAVFTTPEDPTETSQTTTAAPLRKQQKVDDQGPARVAARDPDYDL